MRNQSDLPRRKPLRFPGYDYSRLGVYFVTICVTDKVCLFGHVAPNAVHLNSLGQIVRSTWLMLPNRFPGLKLDAFVVMPNHFHGILAFTRHNNARSVGAGLAPPAPAAPTPIHPSPNTSSQHARMYTLGEVIGAFKSLSTIAVNRFMGKRGARLWQRNYYEHVVRDGEELKNMQQYIAENPMMWALDPDNSSHKKEA